MPGARRSSEVATDSPKPEIPRELVDLHTNRRVDADLEPDKHPREYLPADELSELIKDLRAGLDAAEATGDLTPRNELTAWEATGQVHADRHARSSPASPCARTASARAAG
jgi:hypothetical protein